MPETLNTVRACCACGMGGCMGHTGGRFTEPETLGVWESSGDPYIDTIVESASNRWGPHMMGVGYTVSYSFMESLPSYWGWDSTFTPFNDVMRAAARSALNEWSSVSNLTFVEVSDAGAGGAIRFGANYQYGTYGYAYYPDMGRDLGGDIMVANNVSFNLAPVVGTHGYLTLMHEIGHAIGMKHPGPYGYSDRWPFLPWSIDNQDTTVMSYITGPSDWTGLGWLDVSAVQYLYGRSEPGTLGNVTWGEDTAETFAGDSGINYFIGNGGADLAVLGFGNDGAMGGHGNDTLSGGYGGDLLYGNIGLDNLVGGGGNDTLFGGQNEGGLTYGSGSTLAHREGADTISGGPGEDLLYGNHGGDLLVGGDHRDTLFGGQDEDTLSGGYGSDVLFGNLGDDALYGGVGWDWLYGQDGNDVLIGGHGSDVLYGNLGDDTLSGGTEKDWLYGQEGSDVLTGGDGLDIFYLQSGGGHDTITDFTPYNDYLAVESGINGSGISTVADVVSRARQSGGDFVIDLGPGQTVTLQNYSLSFLSTVDVFLF